MRKGSSCIITRRENWLVVYCLPLALVVAGCSVGPNYKTPSTKAPSAFGNANSAAFSTNETEVAWWKTFNDPILNSLVERAFTNNLDLRIATATLREARALYQNAKFDFLPVASGFGSYHKSRESVAALNGFSVPNRSLELYDLGFDATWELDVFGRVRRSVEASGATVGAAEANRRDVMVSLVSELARNYFELRGTQQELEVARRNATNQQETVTITQARLDGGRGTEFDAARARSQFTSTLALIPPLETAITRSMHRLSVLVGQQPTNLVAELKTAGPLLPLPSSISISTPENLLRRRPDIRIAERQLAASTANIGVAVSDLFPRVTFNGTLAFEAKTLSGLGQPGSDTYSFGPTISWAILDYGHIRARIHAAGARAEASLANYEQTVLTSLEETENVLVEYGQQDRRKNYLAESVQASKIAATLARQRFENGAADFLAVLEAERVLLQVEEQLAISETRTATALVAIYKALGGGWEMSESSSSN